MILAVLQARTTSTRLPGKVLKPVCGQPLILRQIERVRRMKTLDRLILATSDDESDDPLAALCAASGIECFRGDLNDVLKRFYDAAKPHNPAHVVRLTGDCPLFDPGVGDEVVNFYLKGGYDYATNCVEPTYPDGLDIEVFKFSCLEAAFRQAKLASEREHVTPWIRKQPQHKIGHFKGPQDWSALRWTVDEPADFELVKNIYEHLYPANPEFTFNDVLAYLDKNPALKTCNTQHQRNEGLKKSELKDKERA